MDRIRRRQVGAGLLLHPAEFSLQHGKCPDPFPGFPPQHRQRHEFVDREIHGTCPGNIFLLVYWTRPISHVVIFTYFSSRSLSEWELHGVGLCGRVPNCILARNPFDSAIDAQFTKRRSNLVADNINFG